jgi:peptide/nickel transport system substrate-binding protein
MDFYAGNWKFFNGLISYDQDLNLVPDLAATLPEFSPDGKTVTVNLSDDVRFHDGEPLTAEDVVFTWQALTSRWREIRNEARVLQRTIGQAS